MLAAALGFIAMGMYGASELVEVQGDHQLLKTLHTIQVANISSFPRGEMRAKWHSSVPAQKYEDTLTARVRWDDGLTVFNIADHRTVIPPNAQVSSQGSYILIKEGVEGGVISHLLRPHAKGSAYTIDRTGKGLANNRCYQLLPNQLWFLVRQQKSWAEMMEASNFPNSKYEFILRRNGHMAVLIRNSRDGTYRMRVDFDMNKGGNVISSQGGTPSIEDGEAIRRLDQSCTWDWQPVRDGRWWLQSYVLSDTPPPNNPYNHLPAKLEVYIDELNVNPAWSKTDLGPENVLKIAPGTQVMDMTPQGETRTRVGDMAQSPATLDSLAERLKAKGFSKQ